MMTTTLRFFLVIASVLTVIWILRKIRKMKVKMEDAIFWLVFSALIIVLAIFPEISYWLSKLLGIESPANLVFLFVICLLLEKIFTLSIITSQLEEKVSILSAEVALRSQDDKKRINEVKEKINAYDHSVKLWLTASRAYALSKEQYKMLTKKFSLGKVSVYELATAQKERNDAMQRYYSAIKDSYESFFTLRNLALYDFKKNVELEKILFND